MSEEMDADEIGELADAAERVPKLEAKIERLRAALDQIMIGGNHIATWRTDRWPDYGATPDLAMTVLGPGREYDMWCCWNAIMCARDSVNQQFSPVDLTVSCKCGWVGKQSLVTANQNGCPMCGTHFVKWPD